MKKIGFSLIELTITMVVIAIATAAFAPVITKRMKSASTTIVGLSTKCEQRVNENCQLCDVTGCVWCGLSRSTPNKYVDEKSCTHKNCASNCLRCSGPGANCLQCSPGYYLSGGSCLDCPAGQYCLGGNKNPTNCPSGTYQASAGAHISCTNCPAGQYQDTVGQTSCKKCIVGKYQDAIGQSSCTNCPAGQYQDTEGQTSCKKCVVGKYQDAIGQSGCTDCPSGQYQDKEGQTSCIQCPLNYACTASAVTGPCAVGQGSKLNIRTCTDCPTNCKDCEDNSVCQLCNPGYYLSGGSCLGCPAMKYCPANSNRTSYYDCPSGTFSVANSETCSTCSHYGDKCIACNQTTCTQCATNYVLNTSNICVLSTCDAGKYLLGGICTNCTAGNYCTGGTAGQTICPANKWSADMASICTNCDDGTASPQGSNSSDKCIACTTKFGDNCTKCSYTECKECASGYRLFSSTAKPSCNTCAEKFTTNCAGCNTSNCTDCITGYFLNSSKKCQICNSVYHANCSACNSTNCTACASPYSFNATTKTCELAECDQGKYLDMQESSATKGTCINCPKGSYCTGGMNQPIQCDAHHYQPYEGQEMCIPCLWGACMDKVYTDSDHTYYRIWYKSDSTRTKCVEEVLCNIGLWTNPHTGGADYSGKANWVFYYKGNKQTRLYFKGTDKKKCKRNPTKSDCNDKCTSGFCYTEDGKYSMLAGQCTAYIYGMHSNGTVNGACK